MTRQNESPRPRPSFDVSRIRATIDSALASAGLHTGSGPMRGITETIRRALSAAGLHGGSATHGGSTTEADPSVIDVEARVKTDPPGETPVPAGPAADETVATGQFVIRQYTGPAGSMNYKLYVPARAAAESMPLIIMLHGCTQSPDDFAAGTRMNRLAEQHGFIVVYPEQRTSANHSKCWNWFNPADQRRDSGEPSLIAGITQHVAARYPVDSDRVFIAGLSAGAAMAVILGESYPELYAGVGAHSGLPYGVAHDMSSALAAMKGGRGRREASGLPPSGAAPRAKATRFVPTIAFHGDSDRRVGARNGIELIEQATAALVAEAGTPETLTATAVSSRGRRYSRTVHSDRAGRPRVELWVLHGAGHAWSGGDGSGTYTDPTGPDASAEMVRFFLAQRRSGPVQPGSTTPGEAAGMVR
jgi:poly(hydroxyalkanoate) depolymerase family esterase